MTVLQSLRRDAGGMRLFSSVASFCSNVPGSVATSATCWGVDALLDARRSLRRLHITSALEMNSARVSGGPEGVVSCLLAVAVVAAACVAVLSVFDDLPQPATASDSAASASATNLVCNICVPSLGL